MSPLIARRSAELLLVYGLVPAFLLGMLTGGRPSILAQQKVRLESILLPLLVAVAILPALRLPLQDSILVIFAWGVPTLICLAITAINFNRPGFAILLIGLLLNFIVVFANMGMPVLEANARLVDDRSDVGAGLESSWLHIPSDQNTRLLTLADVIPMPGPKGLRGMMSLGDAFIVFGIAKYIFLGMHDWRKAESRLVA